ncbi:MAG: hypothetical protein A3I72_01605 [Candidatus Tectomicrobia bacterium RIFCSPLOWO2_02_FULL_70_19]|nr:MAG: hypothetical protein A3I72_01605 [Candidatus Tectomicrobia bacterium RIFCSPLOWO2_02_FULL_70_19]
MMGLYGTLGLVGVLAAIALVAVWLHSRRAGRRGSFPADTWDPYLQKGGQATPWGTGVPDEVERVAGGPPAAEPDEQYVASRPASDGSVFSRMKNLEAIPITADEERRREEQRRQIEAARAAASSPPRPPQEQEEEGGKESLELIASAPGAAPPAAKAPAPPPPPPGAARPSGNGGRRPWWEDLPTPKDAPFRRSVAQLMGIAVADVPAGAPPVPAAPPDAASLPWSPHIAASPEEQPPLAPAAAPPAPPAEEAAEEAGDFLGLGSEAPSPPEAEGRAPALAEEEPGGILPDLPGEEEPDSRESAPAGAAVGEPLEDASLFAEEEAPAQELPDPLLEEEEPAAISPGLDLEPADEGEAPGEPAQAAQPESFPPGLAEPAGARPAPGEEAPVFARETGEETAEVEEEAVFLAEEEAPAGGEPAALVMEEEAGGVQPETAGLPSGEIGEEAEEAGEAIVLEDMEEVEAEAPAAAAPPAARAGEGLPDLPSEEEGGGDVFAVLRSERGLPAEEVSEEPIGNALLYESNEALENISEQEGVASSRLPAPSTPPAPARPAAVPAAPPPMPEEEAALAARVPAPAAAEAPAASSPADLVRKLASDHCAGDFLLAEEGEVRLPAWAEGVSQAAESDLRERQAAKAAVQPEEYLRLGIVEHLLGRCEEASNHFKEALRRARRLGPVLNALAVATFARGKMDPAIAYCKEAVREAGNDAPLRAAAFRNLGFFYQVKGDHARAAEATVSAIEAAGPKGAPAQLSRLHLRAGQLLRRLGEAERARGHLAESANHFRRGGEDAEWARALVALASAQTQLGESDAALKNLEEAARVCRERGDAAGEALALGQMGGTYTALDQFTRALGYYEKAAAIHREMGNRKGEAAHMSNIGNIHYFRGDLEEAEAAYERALQINREEAHLVGQATSLGNLGRLHLEQGNLERARARLGEARALFKEAGAGEQLEKVRAMLEEVERGG